MLAHIAGLPFEELVMTVLLAVGALIAYRRRPPPPPDGRWSRVEASHPDDLSVGR
jgi:hypothetical protein